MQKDCKSIPAMTQEESMSIEDNWRGRKLREYAARGVFAEWEVGLHPVEQPVLWCLDSFNILYLVHT